MIPKERAEDLVNTYRMILMDEDTDCGNEILCTLIAKQCALICVDEIIKTCPQKEKEIFAISKGLKFWKEVKKEIEKLV